VVFLVSDFLDELPGRTLGISNRRHDLTAITVVDPREQEFPDVGFVWLRDAETGEVLEVDSRDPRVRRMFAADAVRRERSLSEAFRKLGVDQLAIDTRGEYALILRRFFTMRERRAQR
jgi:hypothetical protein